MRQFTILAVVGFGLVVFGTAPVLADSATDLNRLLGDYRASEQKLRRDADLHKAADGSEIYDQHDALAEIETHRQINRDARNRLDRIDPSGMRPQDKLSYQIFRWALDDEQQQLQPDIAELPALLPLSQFDGPQIGFARSIAWRNDNPWPRARDYDNAIRRILNFSQWTSGAIARMQAGLARGFVQPRAVIQRVAAQIDNFGFADPENSELMLPVKTIPAAITGTERRRVEDAYRAAVADELVPALRRFSDFLKTDYLPHTKETPGLGAIPGGKDLYRYLVRSETTSDLSPDEIHALGLQEVARIERAMEQAKDDTGFHGTLPEFRHFLQTDPRFKFRDRAAMLAEFTHARDTVSEHLGELFSTDPGVPLSFRFYDSFAAPDKPAAEYTPGSADGKRPGVVTLNDWDLAERPSYTAEVLELHEGIPGHHLQVSTAMRNTALPRFRRFGEETAFVEGWALYAETLGPELGLYRDPYQKFGALSFDAWRASRLVVDTGIHWLNWTRDQAADYLVAHAGLSRTEALEEVDRYTVLPAQALAYKIGEREILDLRDRAKSALGNKFNLKRFHEALLKDGAMPLPVLDQKMTRWIELERSG